MVIHGGQDFLVAPEKIKPTGEHFKNWNLWEQNGHSIPAESPKEFEEALMKFVSS